MGIFDNVLIGSDLDGTFYSRKEEGYRKNIEAVEYFKANGGIFTFVTGRDLFALDYAIKNVKEIVNAPVVLANGAQLYDYNTAQFVIDIDMDVEKVKKLIIFLYERYPDIGFRISYGEGFYIPVDNAMIRRDLGIGKFDIVRKNLPVEEIDGKKHKFTKAVIIHTPEVLSEVKKLCEEFDKEEDFFFTKSYATGLEMVNSKSTKGKMLKMLRDVHLKQPHRKIFAIGDYHNDYDMITSADYGACPENAEDEIKAAAKIRTVSCDEGAVANLISIIEKSEF